MRGPDANGGHDASWMELPPTTGENAPGARLPMGPMVADLFNRMDAEGVRWAVLRNAEELPQFTRYDIDLLVHPRDLSRVKQLIPAVAGQHGWQMAGRQRKHALDCFLLRSPGADPQYLPLDVFTSLIVRAWRTADAEAVLAMRERSPRGVWVVPPGADAAITSVKELVRHGQLKENSREAVKRGADDDPDRFRATLRPCFGEELSDAWKRACAAGDWPAAEALVPRMRAKLRAAWVRNVSAWIDVFWKNARGLFAPSVSAVVVLVGPDGSGKTTIAQEVAMRMYKRPFKACRYLRSTFGILPKLRTIQSVAARLIGRKVRERTTPEPGAFHSGMMKPLPAARAMIYVPYYCLDLFLGRLLLRRMRLQWSLVFFDRSYYDYYFQLGYRRLPRWYLALFRPLVPKPDLAIFLDQDPEAIFARKPELSVEEIRRQQAVIRELLERLPHARTIDARAGVEETARRVVEEIDKHLRRGEVEARQARR